MIKSELMEVLAVKANLPYAKAEQIVNEIFDAMTDTLIGGGRIEIRGFGSFEVREYGGYTGRNPRTGVDVQVRPKKAPFFKVGKELKERVRGS